MAALYMNTSRSCAESGSTSLMWYEPVHLGRGPGSWTEQCSVTRQHIHVAIDQILIDAVRGSTAVLSSFILSTAIMCRFQAYAWPSKVDNQS